jgi:AcrR family transcriptional regulator
MLREDVWPTTPARRRRRDYHHGDLREAAVAAALAALDAGGPLPSLRDLAARCGVAHPSLYRHFESAEALALAVAAACFRAHTQDVQAAIARETEPLARLNAGCEAAMRWGLAHPWRYALMTSSTLAGKQHHREFFAAAQESFGGLVAGVEACGVDRPVPVAHTLMSAMHGLVDLLRKGRTIPAKAATVDEQIASMLTMVLGYVRGPVSQ